MRLGWIYFISDLVGTEVEMMEMQQMEMTRTFAAM